MFLFPCSSSIAIPAVRFSGLAAYVDRFPANVSAGKFGTERVDAGMVTGNYFSSWGPQRNLADPC